MTNRIRIQNLLRLTLTRKGRAVAKHPLLRDGVIEAVKAGQTETDAEPLWAAPENDEEGSDGDGDEDWYGDFEAHILTIPAEDIPEDWTASFTSFTNDITATKAQVKKKPNYPASRGPFAGPHNSFPIKTQQDVYDAARLVGHAANPAAVRARIISIARSRGFSLPKSWQANKSLDEPEEPMDPEKFEELVTQLSARLTAALTPASIPAPEAQGDVVEKASGHSHEHPHSSMRGYGYSHTHPHNHESMDDHETSDSAHGHNHVSKAEDLPEEVRADLAGLDADLAARTAELEALRAEHETLKSQFTEKAKLADEVEAVRAELAAAIDAAKQPLIASVPQTAEKAAKVDPKTLSFDDALTAILHS